MKWALIHVRDPRAQIAAINALLMLHGIVIQHRTMQLLSRAAGTTRELAEIAVADGSEEVGGLCLKKVRRRPSTGAVVSFSPSQVP